MYLLDEIVKKFNLDVECKKCKRKVDAFVNSKMELELVCVCKNSERVNLK